MLDGRAGNMDLPIPRKLWEHPDPTNTQMWKFKTALEKKVGKKFAVRWRCDDHPTRRRS